MENSTHSENALSDRQAMKNVRNVVLALVGIAAVLIALVLIIV